MSKVKPLPYARPNVLASEASSVLKVLEGPMLTRGSRVQEFEEEVAAFCGAEHAVAFNTGTSALEACYFAAEVGVGDLIIGSPNTFIGTYVGGLKMGGRLLFADLDPQTGSLDPKNLGELVQRPHTRGKSILVPVHFSGLAINMEEVHQQVQSPSTMIIEDACHAFGSSYPQGPRVGSCHWCDMTVFSFHPAKTITTAEGGMVTTNDADLAHRLRLFRNNGIEAEQQYLEGEAGPGYYEVQELTGNYNFTDLQAALGLSQLKRMPQFTRERKKLVTLYRKYLAPFEHIQLSPGEGDERTVYHLLSTQIDFKAYGKTRRQVMQKLQESGVGTQVHYIPCYRHPVLKKLLGDQREKYENSEAYYEKQLSLPLFVGMDDKDVLRVCKALKKALA